MTINAEYFWTIGKRQTYMDRLVFGVSDNDRMLQYTKRAMRIVEKRCRTVHCAARSVKDPIDALCSGRIDIAAVELLQLERTLEQRAAASKAVDKLTIAALFDDIDNRYVLMTRKKDGKHFANAVVEVSDQVCAAQLAERFDGVMCVACEKNMTMQMDSLMSGKCDGILLPAADVIGTGCDKNINLRYHYLDSDAIVPEMGKGVVALVCKEGMAHMEAVAAATGKYIIKRLEIERTLTGEIQNELTKTKENCLYGVSAAICRGKIKVWAYLKKNDKGRHFKDSGSYAKKEELLRTMMLGIRAYLQE